MTISDLGSLGGFISGIAVAVTLIYLAVQVRQNSHIARASIRQSIFENQITYLTQRATDPMVRTALRKATAQQELDDDEASALLFHALVGIRLWEALHFQYEHRMVDEEDWLTARHIISINFQLPVYRQALKRIAPHGVHPKFLAELNQIIDEVQKSSAC